MTSASLHRATAFPILSTPDSGRVQKKNSIQFSVLSFFIVSLEQTTADIYKSSRDHAGVSPYPSFNQVHFGFSEYDTEIHVQSSGPVSSKRILPLTETKVVPSAWHRRPRHGVAHRQPGRLPIVGSDQTRVGAPHTMIP